VELARQLVADYGYLAVLVGTFLEGELVLVAAGFAASRGLLSPGLVMGVAALGAYLGHIFFFALGRWKGKGWILSHPRLGPYAEKADRIITDYGWTSVFVLQYLYGARLTGAVMFGISSFRLPRFLALQTVNCITWAALVAGVGYGLGTTLEAAADRLTWISAGVVAVLLSLALVLWLRRKAP